MAENSSPKVCSKCKAPVEPGSKFCKECGMPLEDVHQSDSPTIECSQCEAQLKTDEEYCTECGAKVEIITKCPSCYAPIEPGTKFCTVCGVNVYHYQKQTKSEDPMDGLKETGKSVIKDAEKIGGGLMKEVGGFLDKATSSSSSKKKIKPQRKDQRFLVCDSCGGYYELQVGEEPEDFADVCDCGGNLRCKITRR
ncbi:MAG TPA: zinc ribbon domain-containing protein [Methanobacteriaceae archaeon]|nr:zinc ribbon domain-containing protein [Methanobacteriaceae archaeon]